MLRAIAPTVLILAALVSSCTKDSKESDFWSDASFDAESKLDAGFEASEEDARTDNDLPEIPDAEDSSVADAGDSSVIPSDSSVSESESDTAVHVPCTKVAHLGDSLTANTVDALEEAYAVYSIAATIDAFGGRAINEYCCGDKMNGKQAAAKLVDSGFEGCWVIALGTNDTANVSAGAVISRAARIDAMMNLIDPDSETTVMWVNTYTTVTDGHWSQANMMLWNEELEKARSRWPNMRIFDWASIAKTGSAPFSDGIHHTDAGYEVRNAAIAKAASEL